MIEQRERSGASLKLRNAHRGTALGDAVVAKGLARLKLVLSARRTSESRVDLVQCCRDWAANAKRGALNTTN